MLESKRKNYVMSKQSFIDSLPALRSDVIFDNDFGSDHFYIIETVYFNDIKKHLSQFPSYQWNTGKNVKLQADLNWLIVFNDTTIANITGNNSVYAKFDKDGIISGIKKIANNSLDKINIINTIINYYYLDKDEMEIIINTIVREIEDNDYGSGIKLFYHFVSYMQKELDTVGKI